MSVSREQFKLGRLPYVALVTLREISTPLDDPVWAALYAPGTVCFCARDHWQTAASTRYSFLVSIAPARGQPSTWALLGPDCLRGRFPGADLQPWITALEGRHPLAGTGLGVDWREQTRREYWRWVPLLGMALQVEPEHGFMRGCLARATGQEKRPFTEAELKRVKEMLKERGETARVIRARRDLAFRLQRLSVLGLNGEDWEKVLSLWRYQKGWRSGQMKSLTEGQVRLVGFLEARHTKRRKELSDTLACALAEGLNLGPPYP